MDVGNKNVFDFLLRREMQRRGGAAGINEQ
jgi:hypothetical protein